MRFFLNGIFSSEIRLRNFCAAVSIGAAFILSAVPLQAQSDLAKLRAALYLDPDNRAVRWAISQVAFQAERYDVARYHVTQLLRTSRSQEDVETLTRALAKINAEDPWNFNLSFALRPSDNIRRYTYNDSFETALGIFTPTGSGQAQSGVGATVGAALSYTLGLADQSLLTFIGRVDHSIHDTSDLDTTRLFLAARHDRFTVGRNTTIEPYLRFRLNRDLALERRDFGLHYAKHFFLKDGNQFSLSATAEDRDYLIDEALSGAYGRITLRYGHVLDAKTRFGIGFTAARSDVRADHLKYWEARIAVDATRRVDKIGTFGIFGQYTSRPYDGKFPATDIFRADETFAIGVSYQPERLVIFGARPKISCQTERNSSNIALYDYKATDCGFTFHRVF